MSSQTGEAHPRGILLLGRCGLERVATRLRERIDVEVVVGGWTQVELVDRLSPALVYVDLFGWDTVGRLTTAALHDRVEVLDAAPLVAVVEALRGRPEVVYRGLRPPSGGAFGLLGHSEGLRRGLKTLRRVVEGERVLDVAGLWARDGIVLDDVRFGMGHGEAGMEGAEAESRWVEALWRARVEPPIKCVVVDLDDTLIHGQVVAEDFHDKNPAYLPEGDAARRPQVEGWWRLRRGLHEALRIVGSRGIMLALATRNDPSVVARRWRKRPAVPDREAGLYAWMYDDLPADLREAAFLNHPQTLTALSLGPEDMVQIEAGFGPKSQMCRRIAERLGVGLDTLAFIDDSAFEREEVRANAPEVLILEGDRAAWRDALLLGGRFTPWVVSEAARRRPASYRSRAAVVEASERESTRGLEGFLEGLGLQIGVRAADPSDLPRIDELLRRTHQLNLTGRHVALTTETLEGVYVGWCRDRIADHGVISAGVFRDGALISWTCSCRVLPHRVAGSLLAEMWRREPGAILERVATERNGATIGLIEEAREGVAVWVEVVER